MTIHKAQGRTIPKVIVDLSCHPTKYAEMKFAAIFVVMSRVKNKVIFVYYLTKKQKCY